MLIENPDAFKSWLTGVLEPLCDADPAALAKYVYALVKKDKPVEDLRDGMIDQLDVFLQAETKPFVRLLFDALETQEYLRGAAAATAAPPQEAAAAQPPPPPSERNGKATATTEVAKPKQKASSSSVVVVEKKESPAAQRIVLNRTTKLTPAPKEKPAYATEQTLVKVVPDLLEDGLDDRPAPARSSKRDKKTDGDKEERRKRNYKSRSRSRSWDRARRPVAPGARPLWRNRSPPSQAARYERRRSRSGSPPVRAPRYRNRSPPPAADNEAAANRSRSRSRERNSSPSLPPTANRGDRSPRDRDRQSRNRDRAVDREGGKGDAKAVDRDRDSREERPPREGRSGGATPTQDSNPGDSGPPVRGGTTTLAGIFTPAPKKRCRDFDERGYCMRGDLCQFDHGTDPVVLEDALSHMLTLPMTRPPPRHPPAEYNPLTPYIGARTSGPGGAAAMYPTPPPAYFPFLSGPPPPPPGHHPVQRELIPVPIARAENVPPHSSNLEGHISGGARGATMPGGAPLAPLVAPSNNHSVPPPVHVAKKKFDFSRLGPNRHGGPKATGGNCSLELKKVPRGLNDIMHLNNHFSKFGKIVNIQVSYEDDPEAALITFSSHTEANVAYKSTEAVLNNRFIKVFWHNSEQSKQESVAAPRIPAKDRLTTNNTHMNNNNHVSHNKVLINKDTTKVNKPMENKAAPPTTANEEEPKKNGEEVTTTSTTATKKDPQQSSAVISMADTTTVKRPDSAAASVKLAAMVRRRGEGAARLARDLKCRSQKLLDRQLHQQKGLLERLEAGKCTDGQKEILIKAIKDMQKTIEKTRKDLVTVPKTVAQAKKAAFGNLKKVPRSKEEAQKEILDAELDLITKQQEGQDVTELQKYVAELKRQQITFKAAPVRRTSVNRLTTVRGRGFKASVPGKFVNQSVDHRPRSFLVSGYESDELEQLIKHFTQFGEIVEKEVDSTTPSLWLQFRSRKIAEQAASKGRQFNDRTLTVTWQPKSAPAIQPVAVHEESTSKADAFEPQSPRNYSPSEYMMYSDALDDPSEKFDRNLPAYSMGDSEDEEGKDYDKEEERSWRR